MGVADHELIHALYDLGLFTKEEWSVLTNAAKKRKFVKVNKDGTTTTRSFGTPSMREQRRITVAGKKL